MILFSCTGCGRSFSVADTHAGRRAVCKGCGAAIVVPAAKPAEPAAPGNAPVIPLRQRRLTSDARNLAAAFASFPAIHVTPAAGNPPDVYEIEYHVRGLERGGDDQPIPRDVHRVEIRLHTDYPRLAPHCRMLTPMFHPNVDANTICVGDHWTAGERLTNLVIRIGEMIAYQAYNIKSPLDAEAAMWADLNPGQLPIDSQNLHPAEE
jgi:ubiquitin-protein ligase